MQQQTTDPTAVDSLVGLGELKATASMLVTLRDGQWHTSRDIQDRAGIPQPLVSRAAAHLQKRSWIESRSQPAPMGRPMLAYRLTVSAEAIRTHYGQQAKLQVEDLQQQLRLVEAMFQ